MDTRERRPSGGNTAVRQRRTERRPGQNKRSSDVVYTQPEVFNRRRFVLRLVTVAAVVLALLFGMTIFFKVNIEKSTVSGTVKYTAWDVWEASGIQNGENLLTLNKERAYSKIKKALPYVDTIRIGIKLPDTVNIEIKELAVTYAVEADDGSWWKIAYDGTVVEKTTAGEADAITKIIGVKITKPTVAEKCVAAEAAVSETDPSAPTKPVTVLGSERLAVVLDILGKLEKNGVIGEMVSIDVSDMARLQMWYGTRYQINLGDSSQMEKKISYMKQAIDQRGPYQTGALDVSFTLSENVCFNELPQ